MHPDHVQYVQQLVSALSLPSQSLEEPKEKYYSIDPVNDAEFVAAE